MMPPPPQPFQNQQIYLVLGTQHKNPKLPLCMLISLNTLHRKFTLQFPASFFFFFPHFLKSLFKWQQPAAHFQSVDSISAHKLGEAAAQEKVDQPQAKCGAAKFAFVWPRALPLLKAPVLYFLQFVALPIKFPESFPLSKSPSQINPAYVSYIRGDCHATSPRSICIQPFSSEEGMTRFSP